MHTETSPRHRYSSAGTYLANWRFEVAAPLTERTYSLHVFQVSNEDTQEMTDVDLRQSRGSVGVGIGSQWEVSFNETGMLGGNVKSNSGKSVELSDKLEVAEQYQRWNIALQNN